MPAVGAHDAFETEYTKRLVAVLAGHGLPVEYDKDRAAVDAALHMYVEGNGDRQVSHTRVWFQAKGKRATTLSADTFYAADHVAVRVPVDHLKFWYAAPEAVYLVVYVEAVDQFLAEDVRDIVERMWPHGEFYASVPITQKDVTVHVRTDALLDTDAFKRMLRHRSIRADGPAFRGRPLGHRFDPIRSQIDVCESELFDRIVGRLLAAHGFREVSRRSLGDGIEVWDGRLYQTLEWQSPAFAEYGYDEDSAGFRIEPPVDHVHGEVAVIVDTEPRRGHLSNSERSLVQEAVAHASQVLVAFNGEELSGTGGTWRSATQPAGGGASVTLFGLESVTSALLVATLVYLDFAATIRWKHVNYQDSI